MSQTRATRLGDYIAPPTQTVGTTFNAVRTITVATSAGNTDLHASITDPSLFPDGYFVTLQLVSGGPVYFSFASSTGTTATAALGWALVNPGESQPFLLDGPTNTTGPAGTATPNYPHRYLMHIADATATVKLYVSTKQEPV